MDDLSGVDVSHGSNASADPAHLLPPSHLKDPYVKRLTRSRAHWSRHIRGRLPKFAEYAVARALADYGNRDGSNCHPGIARLATDLSSSEKSVKRALEWLAEAGWITLTSRGRRRLGEANVYRLTIPATVATELNLWEEKFGGCWMERPSWEAKRPSFTGHWSPLEPKAVKEPNPSAAPSSRGHSGLFGGHMEPSLGDTGDPPPGSTHQVLSLHQSEFLTRPHADAWGDEEDLHEEIEERAEAILGHILYSCTGTMIDGMLSTGAHPNAVLNAVLARERDPLAWGA